MNAQFLTEAILAVCPIYGASSDGRIDFADDATDAQKLAAKSILDSWTTENDLGGYAYQRRQKYPPVGDALDAIMKEFNSRRLNGESLSKDVEAWVDSCLQVKKEFPKPE